ncbi:MAG TPA: ferredoxin family protein [Candidatus Fermentibacter sp.]|nr:ferredoxin family protein [Candidatus Fermentibacter sp.]HRY61752.1 ferredoxin family protein [Candidatus Fermentibacter sp.]
MARKTGQESTGNTPPVDPKAPPAAAQAPEAAACGQGETCSYVHIFQEWCKGCGICVAFCPKHVLEMGRNQKAFVARPGDCIRCYLCARRCPDFAVTITEELERIRQEGAES